MVARSPVVVALLLMCAGCAGLGGFGSDETTQTTDPSTTAPTTAPTATTAPTTTTATTPTTKTTTTIPSSSVVTFENLSATDQRFFLNLLENGSLVAPPPFELAFDPDYGPGYEYVRYRGALYRIIRAETYQLRGRYSLDIERSNVSAGTLPVTAYRNLSARAQTVFRNSLIGEVPDRGYPAEEFPTEAFNLSTDRIILYNGTAYAVGLEVGDYMPYEYVVTKVRDD